jgi:hypothetical protein
MPNVRLPRGVCAVVASMMHGSHIRLNALFKSSGAPGEPPNLPHDTKWKEWLFLAGQDPNVDSLAVLGNILEEFMDIEPQDEDGEDIAIEWKNNRERVVNVLEENGFRYYRGGRVLPSGVLPEEVFPSVIRPINGGPRKPADIEELLVVLVKNLRRAMNPLTQRRKGSICLSFETEYDVQDLLHALLRPWVSDIRPEEFTPSYAGSSTRMDFFLPAHKLVLELKFVRDANHAGKIGNELIIDIEHYRRHSGCDSLWCVVYDPNHLIANADGLKKDLEGERKTKDGTVDVRVFVLQAS